MADTKLSALSQISAPALTDKLYTVDGGPTSYHVTGARFLGQLHHICQGRLTTETGVPISTSDRTSQGTIYFTPYNGNNVALYDGTRWSLYTFTEKSLALTATSGKNYDVFLYDNAGTLTLELSAAWTNDTTRADALTTQDGVYVKSGATTRRYLGTFRASGSNVTEDSAANRLVYSYCNKVLRSAAASAAGGSHSYTTSSWRAWGNTTTTVAWVQGIAEDGVTIGMQAEITQSGSGTMYAGWEYDGNGTGGATIYFSMNTGTISAGTAQVLTSALGYHYLTATEFSFSSSNTFWNNIIGAQVRC